MEAPRIAKGFHVGFRQAAGGRLEVVHGVVVKVAAQSANSALPFGIGPEVRPSPSVPLQHQTEVRHFDENEKPRLSHENPADPEALRT